MDIHSQIEALRRRTWQGDRAAGEALAQLLERYVYIIVRRALRQRIQATWPNPVIVPVEATAAAGAICRDLCRELLQPGGRPCAIETIRNPPATCRRSRNG